jgi:hypothetical protein
MDALRTGIMSVFTAAPGGVNNDLYVALNGRLFYGDAPAGISLSDGPYGIFFFVSDTPDDVFAKDGKEDYVQFSFFSGASSPAEILDLDLHLTALFKDKSFTVTGWTVVNMKRVQGNGPTNISADVEDATGNYWQYDIDYVVNRQAS